MGHESSDGTGELVRSKYIHYIHTHISKPDVGFLFYGKTSSASSYSMPTQEIDH